MNKDKIKISNPLTIIGLFAGIAEVAGTIVLPFVSENLQGFFIWYVMLFPAFLVGLFFYTLIKHPQNLYAPGDFRDENNFMTLFKQLGNELKELSDNEPTISDKIQPIYEKLTNELDYVRNYNIITKMEFSRIKQQELAAYLKLIGKPATFAEIQSASKLSKDDLVRALDGLVSAEHVIYDPEKKVYKLSH